MVRSAAEAQAAAKQAVAKANVTAAAQSAAPAQAAVEEEGDGVVRGVQRGLVVGQAKSMPFLPGVPSLPSLANGAEPSSDQEGLPSPAGSAAKASRLLEETDSWLARSAALNDSGGAAAAGEQPPLADDLSRRAAFSHRSRRAAEPSDVISTRIMDAFARRLQGHARAALVSRRAAKAAERQTAAVCIQRHMRGALGRVRQQHSLPFPSLPSRPSS